MNAPPSTCEAPLWARHGAVEPFVATAAFALWINLFRVLESRGDARQALRMGVALSCLELVDGSSALLIVILKPTA